MCFISCKAQKEIKQLTRKEKVEDFAYLYQELKESYPYFEINKRMNNIDWLSKKEEYSNKIKQTKNDKEYFKELTNILNDLNNGHTDTYPTVIYSYFYNAYKGAVATDSIYDLTVKELEKTDSIKTKYWKKINNEVFFSNKKNAKKSTGTSSEKHIVVEKNINTSFIDSLNTATIHIKTFSYDYVDNDIKELKSFFKKAHSYKNLIIDIQGNDGGSTEYWLENMIPYLIDKDLKYPLIYGFKNSARLKKFKPDYFKNTISYNKINLPNLPKELKKGDYLFRSDSITIKALPNNKKYTGNIYLLVDNVVYSSSEALAYFCKATKFATVVGEKTSGDGVGTDPLLLTLPNSGIVIRFTGEMGLNPDGSANEEAKTIPNIKIKAISKKERLFKLLQLIAKKKISY